MGLLRILALVAAFAVVHGRVGASKLLCCCHSDHYLLTGSLIFFCMHRRTFSTADKHQESKALVAQEVAVEVRLSVLIVTFLRAVHVIVSFRTESLTRVRVLTFHYSPTTTTTTTTSITMNMVHTAAIAAARVALAAKPTKSRNTLVRLAVRCAHRATSEWVEFCCSALALRLDLLTASPHGSERLLQ